MLTLHHDVFALPEVVLILEQRRVERRLLLELLPLRPVTPKVGRVPDHVRAPSLVGKRIRVARYAERRVVVIRIGEHHDVLRRTFPQQEVIGGLRKLFSIRPPHQRKHRRSRALTLVETPA